MQPLVGVRESETSCFTFRAPYTLILNRLRAVLSGKFVFVCSKILVIWYNGSLEAIEQL